MSVSVSDIIKKTYKQIPKDKCEMGGGKHINTITDPTVGYCLCPEGQSIVDPANPKCALIDPKTPYDPFNSGFYREGTQCKAEEGLVTQKHPFHQNFGEPACISAAPVCATGFNKEQLRYDGEVLDYCIRKDANGKYVASYYPTAFLVRPTDPAPVAKPEPPKEEKPKLTWLWWTIGGVVGVVLVVGLIFMALKLFGSKSAPSTDSLPQPASASSIVMPPTPVAPSPVVSPFNNTTAKPLTPFAAPAPVAPAPVADLKGGKGRGKGRGGKRK